MPTNNLANNRTLNANANMTGGITWVSGLNGARSWKQYPNTIDILMDNVNKNIYYIKIADEIGNCKNLRAFEYSEIPIEDVPLQDANTPAMNNFVTKEDFASFKNEMLEAIKSLNNKKQHNNGGAQRNELHNKKDNYYPDQG